MKEVGVNSRVKLPGPGADPVGGPQGESGGASVTPKAEKTATPLGSGDQLLKSGPPQAPDGGLQVSVTVRTGAKTTLAADLNAQVPERETGVPWQPDLQACSDRGVTRFTPVSTPWAPTFEGAIDAAKNVQPLPNLSTSVREAESTFRAMVKADPVGVAGAYLTQVKAARQRTVARLQGQLKKAMTAALEGVPPDQPDALIAAARTAANQMPHMKDGSKAKLVEAFATQLRTDPSVKTATQAMLSAVHVPLKIETDEIKLMSPHFNGTKVKLSDSVYDGADATKIGPAVFNTALHPTATAVARLALEMLLKETKGPLVVMAGGVAAGKGYAAKKANFDDSDAAVVFDPDGESSQTFLETVEKLALDNGSPMRMVGVVTDPVAAWLRALNRSFEEGRTVSETAFSHSHSTGVQNMITSARGLRERGQDVVLIDNNTVPKLYAGEPPPPMRLQETYGRVESITDALDETGKVPGWVRELFGSNAYMMDNVIGPLEEKMQTPGLLQEKKAIFDSLKEDRRVFEYAHPKV